jgi:predicted RNA-binding protein with PUA domain
VRGFTIIVVVFEQAKYDWKFESETGGEERMRRRQTVRRIHRKMK